VLAAAALRCIGGQIQGRLLFRNDDEKARAHRMGIQDLNRKYTPEEMAKGDVIFAATGVTNGAMLEGVHYKSDRKKYTTSSVVMRSRTQTVRWVKGEHTVGKA
jgi:fructose-1,6-bisphosphatase II / sedoheptulose-1,7-bisphosphatase